MKENKYLIRLKNNSNDYDKQYMKIRFYSDDDLPLEKALKNVRRYLYRNLSEKEKKR